MGIAAYAGLKKIAHMVFPCQCQQLAALFRHQLLVGRHHMLAGLQRPPGIRIRCIHAADGHHHHADVRVLQDF